MDGPDLNEIEYTVHAYQDVHIQVKPICDLVAEKIVKPVLRGHIGDKEKVTL